MKTWNNYKDYAKSIDTNAKNDIEEIEDVASIICVIIKRRTELGITQRELASLCDIPQSTIGRIESFKTVPNLETVIKIMQPLGLKFTISKQDEA